MRAKLSRVERPAPPSGVSRRTPSSPSGSGRSAAAACRSGAPRSARARGARAGGAGAIRALASRGVPVHAWLVLPRAQGYFATADNAAAVAAECEALLAWLRREQLPVTTIGIDVEMDIVHMEALASAPWRLAGPAL